MIRIILLLLLTGFSSGYSYATCYGSAMEYGLTLAVDLSDKLSAKTPVWEATYNTQYTGTFNCKFSRRIEFGYTTILSTNNTSATIIGFNNGKDWVRAEIIGTPPNKKLSAGGHSASELNVPFTVRFSLVGAPPGTGGQRVPGNTLFLQDVLFVTDLSGMSFLQIIGWPAKQLLKILRWLLSGFKWPYDDRDMYGQPMTITYAPKATTCNFDNAGLTVPLPNVSMAQVLGNNQPGYTPFSLNLSCQNMLMGVMSTRAIDMFLSSNNLLAGDATVLIDKNPTSAQGVGLRLVKRDMPNAPVSLSTSNINRGTATSLFNVVTGDALDSNFTIGMGVYYYPYQSKKLTQGNIKTSATLNIIYP